MLFPVPCAREPSIGHLATSAMQSLLTGAGFKIADVHDSAAESQHWFEAQGAPVAAFQARISPRRPATRSTTCGTAAYAL